VTPATGTAFWRDRPTLVTGASGLVGSWLVKRLLAAQADVVCLIRDWVPQSELMGSKVVEQVKAVRGELRDQRLLERLIGEYEIDTVLHLAAQTIVPIANRNPISTFETNIAGTWALLEACRRSPTVKQIVVASSDKSYGEQEQLPYEENMALAGRHPYDVSKSAGDLIAQSYAATYDLPVVITRCGNFYGGGDLNWSRIVPGTIRSVLRGKRPVIRSDGQSIRDYFYVEDGAAAYAFLAEHLAADGSLAGEAFNFSNEEPITVLDLTNKILALMGSDLKPDVRNEATNEIKCQYLSAAKAREKLGWRPLFQLEHGLLLTIDWYRDLLGGER
jgi:CDP-glucose 4,6-dehydratase